MKILIAVLLLIVACGSIKAQTSDDSLYVAGMTMRLGMPRGQIINYLNGRYQLTKIEGQDDFIISEKDASTNSYKIIGQVAFKNNRLSYIVKEWTPDDSQQTDAFSVGSALYYALNQAVPTQENPDKKYGITGEAKTTVMLQTHLLQNPAGT